ncbi:MAG: hypothetical protein ABI433_03660 [Burkholderiaceae bacterium]
MTITIRRVTTKDAAALAKLMSDPAVYGAPPPRDGPGHFGRPHGAAAGCAHAMARFHPASASIFTSSAEP